MNLFQLFGIVFCSVQAIQSSHRFARRRAITHIAFAVVWSIAAICFVFPDATSTLANTLGVTRGSDLIFYILSLFFLWAHFQQFTRYKSTQRVLTDLVRSIAIENARCPAEAGVSVER